VHQLQVSRSVVTYTCWYSADRWWVIKWLKQLLWPEQPGVATHFFYTCEVSGYIAKHDHQHALLSCPLLVFIPPRYLRRHS
jgi:hypothetical protein